MDQRTKWAQVVEALNDTTLAQTSDAVFMVYQDALRAIKRQAKAYLDNYDVLSFAQRLEAERLLAVGDQIKDILDKTTGTVAKTIKQGTAEQIANSYYGTYYALEGANNLNMPVTMLDKGYIDRIVNQPVEGKTLSRRLYQNRDRLAKAATQSLLQGAIDGKGYAYVAKRIEDLTEADYKRALRIARTEGGRASSLATQRAYEEAEEAGLDLQKTWVSTLDKKTRHSHQELDGQTVPIDDDFVSPITGAKGKGPRLLGRASEDINCRCTTITVVDGISPELRRDNETGETIQNMTYNEWLASKGMQQAPAGQIPPIVAATKAEQKPDMAKVKEELENYVGGGYGSVNQAVSDDTYAYIEDNMTETSEKLYRVESGNFTADKLKPGDTFEFDSDIRSFSRNRGGYIDNMIDEGIKEDFLTDPVIFETVGKSYHFNMDPYTSNYYEDQSESLVGGRFKVVEIVQRNVKGNTVRVFKIQQIDIDAAVQGKQMINAHLDNNWEYDYDIEYVINKQGYNGLPQVVDADTFDEATRKSNFYAERTYAASSQEVLDEYRKQLYEGDWYVDCSAGGAQYGQGMYTAAVYDLDDGNGLGGIEIEMMHYQELNYDRGNPFHYTERITLTPDAKIFTMLESDGRDLKREWRYNSFLNTLTDPDEIKAVTTEYELNKKLDDLLYDVLEKSPNDRRRILTEAEKIRDQLYDLENQYERLLMYSGVHTPNADLGTLAAELGYDAINATGHGMSGSYTVILNRTKVILQKGGK